MSLHTGSSALAHNLDRFDIRADFELVSAEAARLKVEPETIRLYREWYGDEPVIVKVKGLIAQMPAYEAEIRWQALGQAVQFIRSPANVI